MQDKVKGNGLLLGVKAVRRVVTRGGAWAFGPHNALGSHFGCDERAGGSIWKYQLAVVVKGGAGKALQLCSAQDDAQQVRGDGVNGLNVEFAKTQFMAHTFWSAVRGDLSHVSIVVENQLPCILFKQKTFFSCQYLSCLSGHSGMRFGLLYSGQALQK